MVLALSCNTTLPQQLFNSSLPPSEAIVLETRLLTQVTRESLSSKLDDHLFKVLLDVFSIADKARLLSLNAASWLSVTPSEGLCLHLDPSQFQVAIKWWLGLEFSYGSCCPLCPDIALDPLGHHAGVVMWFLATAKCVMSLRSPVGELIWVEMVAMSPPINRSS